MIRHDPFHEEVVLVNIQSSRPRASDTRDHLFSRLFRSSTAFVEAVSSGDRGAVSEAGGQLARDYHEFHMQEGPSSYPSFDELVTRPLKVRFKAYDGMRLEGYDEAMEMADACSRHCAAKLGDGGVPGFSRLTAGLERNVGFDMKVLLIESARSAASKVHIDRHRLKREHEGLGEKKSVASSLFFNIRDFALSREAAAADAGQISRKRFADEVLSRLHKEYERSPYDRYLEGGDMHAAFHLVQRNVPLDKGDNLHKLERVNFHVMTIERGNRMKPESEGIAFGM